MAVRKGLLQEPLGYNYESVVYLANERKELLTSMVQMNNQIIEIIKQCQAGSREAFKSLVEHYQRAAYTIAYQMLFDSESAKDISQEAFIRVFNSIKKFDLSKNFYTWLYQIVVNLCIDYLRKYKNPNSPKAFGGGVLNKKKAALQEAPDEIVIRTEEQEKVRCTLDRLPLKYKTVLVLRDIEGLSTEEVAHVLKCSQVAARWRLYKARKLFKEEYYVKEERV